MGMPNHWTNQERNGQVLVDNVCIKAKDFVKMLGKARKRVTIRSARTLTERPVSEEEGFTPKTT